MTDFDTIIPRRGTDCVKWDLVPEGVIPMWVADMDFEVAECIREAVRKRVEHGIYGYTVVSSSYRNAVCNWLGERHGWRPDPSWIIPVTGVVPAIAACLRAFTVPGDKVLLTGPVYNCFYDCVRNYGCTLADVPLLTENTPDGLRYVIDFDALEAAASGARVMLICSPHNPAGRVWTKEELQRVGEICLRHGVIPVVDEIHCEFTMPGHTFVPFASVSPAFEDRCITLCSATKAFNIAGLPMASAIVKDPLLRGMLSKAVDANEIGNISPFSIVAAEAAFSDGGHEWLRGVCEQVYGNYTFLRDALEAVPAVHLYVLEGTYLAWLDIKAICYDAAGELVMPSDEVVNSLVDSEKVRLNSGSMYGSEGFLRINLACPASMSREGSGRLVAGLKRLLGL